MGCWKKITALAAAVLLGITGMTAFAAEAGNYSWQGHEIEVTAVEKGGMFAPAGMKDDEYCVSVYMKVDEELWQDEDLGHALYEDTVLEDPEGNIFSPQAALKGSKEPTRTYLFCIPRGTEIPDLALRFGAEAGEEGSGPAGYVWDGMTFELTEVTEELGMWKSQLSSPEGKWVLAVFTITGGEMEFKALEERIFAPDGIRMNNAEPKAITAQGVRITDDMKAVAVGTVNVFFDMPADLELGSVSVTVGGEGAGTAVPETDGSVTIVSSSGGELTLTPMDPEAFAGQDDGVIVHTRIGTTVHSSGSQFRAGSGMRLKNMRNTVQYEKPKAVFTYDTDLELDAAADAIGEIGETAALMLDGKEVPVQVAWITSEMACFIFDCDALPDSVPEFRLQDGALRIIP